MTKSAPADHVTADDIVVGLDPTTSGPAVTWAIDAARASGHRVVLLQAVDVSAHRFWMVEAMLGERVLHFHRRGMRRAVDQARSEAGPDVQIHGLVAPGRPHAVLTDAARRADQVVIGVEARSLGSRLVLGSMGHHLLRTAPCPVVLVPLLPAAPDLAFSDTERIVVAVGGSTGAAAIGYAFDTADQRHLPLVLLHAGGQDMGPAAVENRVHLYEIIEAEQGLHPEVQTIPVTVTTDLATATRENVGPHDLLVLGNREVDRPAPPIVDRVLLPLLRHPRQVLVVVADPHDTSAAVDPLLVAHRDAD